MWNDHRSALLCACFAFATTLHATAASAQTASGEIEGRAAPVSRRICLAGANSGSLCNENADCPGSSCRDRNVFSVSVAVHYDAPAGDLTAIENMLTAVSATLLDVTDGQAEIGLATIHNDATGTAEADLRVYPATCTSGPNVGAACATNADCGAGGACGVWWQANTGNFRVGGNMHVSINFINAAAAGAGNVLAHEFVHLVFDARDEYESRPGCGANTGAGNCPDPATVGAGQVECLMDSNVTELCWGQGDPTDLTDVAAGNHDASNITEQSQCRSNRSCWDQVVWSWPNTFLKPAAAPNPGTGGAVVGPTNFVRTNDTTRVVLVLDESGSMALESPTRMDRLKVAAGDFLALSDDAAEVGLVSFASDAAAASGRAREAVAALSGNRAALEGAVNGLAPSTRTNIGDGLLAARDLIAAAAGTAGSTYVVLMTDGINNEPQPATSAADHLQDQLDLLLAAGIPVYVTCTGGDLGLQSQCSEIAAATNGFYVDASDASKLPLSFVDIHQRIHGREAVHLSEGKLLGKDGQTVTHEVLVDPGSRSLMITLQWVDPRGSADLRVTDPDGKSHDARSMPQGRFVRADKPTAGVWKVTQVGASGSGQLVLRAWVRNPIHSLAAGLRRPSVRLNDDLVLFAYPRGPGGGLTRTDGKVVARVMRPDGSRDSLDLFDRGHGAGGAGVLDLGDDVAGDAVFTGVYRNTDLKGAYTFTLGAEVDGWVLGHDAHERDPATRQVRFIRAITLSAAVGDPNDRVITPEDDKRPPTKGCDPCQRWILIIVLVIALLILIGGIAVWRCCRRRALLSTVQR